MKRKSMEVIGFFIQLVESNNEELLLDLSFNGWFEW
jgi:hypothetical protein